MKIFGRIILILLVLLPLCQSISAGQNESQRYAPELKQLMAEVMAEYEVPGMAMAIRFADGSTLSYAAGLADRSSGERLTPAHHFRIGSTTKSITATAVLLLCERGAFNLDDRVAKLLPEIREFGAGGALHDSAITVRMLMQHTSGLKDYVEGELHGEEMIDIMVDNPLAPIRFQDMVTISYSMGLVEPVDTTFTYSNTNYVLLGLLIEKFGKMSYSDFVRQNIFVPLQLNETSVPETSDMPAPYAHGYLEKEGDGKLDDFTRQHPTGVWAAGNVISTPENLLHWLQALLEGKLLSPEFKAEQLAIRDFPEAHIGYGLGVADMGGGLGHNGTVMGYQTWMVAYKGMYVVIFNNCLYASKNVHISNLLFDRLVKVMFP